MQLFYMILLYDAVVNDDSFTRFFYVHILRPYACYE